MSFEDREIKALLKLIDDPDQEVFDTVADKILHYGSGIIPSLETYWEETPDEIVQERVELLIHRVNYQNLREDFMLWIQADTPDLLTGAILAARYKYPGLDASFILNEIKKIERNIWLELNNYLTPLEKINVLNSMIYSYFGIKGADVAYDKPDHFFINKVVESRKGNAITIGILYQALCRRLDIPIYAIGLPRQFILGYFNREDASFPTNILPVDIATLKSSVLFFVDPLQGQIYTGDDVEVYLKKLNIAMRPNYLQPQSVKNIICMLLNELSLCFENKKEHYRFEELKELVAIIDDGAPGQHL